MGESRQDEQLRYLFPALTTYYSEPLMLERAKGMFVWDKENKRYLDFFGGILTVSVGHCDDEITERICQQLKKLQHTSTLYVTDPQVKLAKRLAELPPEDLTKSFFTNSGTEANEMAVLLAQMHTGRKEVVALRHSYSGRSMLAMSLSGQHPWRLASAGTAGVKHAHSPYCFRCSLGLSYPECGVRCAHDVENLIQTTTSGEIAAFIAEPIQGVGGFITPPPEYFEIVAGIVRKYGGLFICDEVQTGFGRTGEKWFGIEHWKVKPDIITCAKGMGNGTPVAATITTSEIAGALQGSTISTFGGNPVSATAAEATIQCIEERDLLTNTESMGQILEKGLNLLKKEHEIIGDVRGKGLMLGVELVKHPKKPAPDLADRVLEEAKDRGLLLGKGGLHGNALRISPPMSVNAEQIEDALGILEEVFTVVS